MKKKVITIISNTNNALAFEWAAQYLNKDLFELQFVFLNPSGSALQKNLAKNNFKTFLITYKGKISAPFAFLKITSILLREKPQIVHTHLFDASLLGLFAAKICGIKKRIHTRHHSNSNQVYAPKAVKYDLFINKQSTDIIAISKNVADVLINDELVPAKKVHIIYHGLDMNSTENISSERINKLRDKYKTDHRQPIVGVISRYIHLKGVQYIIPAFKKLLKTNPNAYLILANAKGNYSTEIKKMLAEIPSGNYIEIEFEEDLFALYKLFDLYIHVPIDKKCEAFGQTYIEALASKTPSVFTLSGIASEFIKNGDNALVVNYRDSDDIFDKITALLQDKELCQKLSANGYKEVKSKFNIMDTIKKQEELYLKNS